MKSNFEKEREKIAGIHGRKAKAEYIWDYYKLWIIGILAAVIFTVFFIQRFFFAVTDNWIYIMFTNTYADVGRGSEFWQDYVDRMGFDLDEKNVVFNNSSYFDYSKNVTGNSYFESFTAYTEGGTLDAVTMEKDSLTALGRSGRLLDLDSEKCAGIKEKYGDRFLYSEPFDEEYGDGPVPVGIDISDSVLMTEYHIYTDTCALGIGAYSEHVDEVEAFLDYIYGEV